MYRPQRFLASVEYTGIERLGLIVCALGSVELQDVIEARRHIGMYWPERLLANCEALLRQWNSILRLAFAVEFSTKALSRLDSSRAAWELGVDDGDCAPLRCAQPTSAVTKQHAELSNHGPIPRALPNSRKASQAGASEAALVLPCRAALSTRAHNL